MDWDKKFILRPKVDVSTGFYQAYAFADTAQALTSINVVGGGTNAIAKSKYEATVVAGSARQVTIGSQPGMKTMFTYQLLRRVQ